MKSISTLLMQQRKCCYKLPVHRHNRLFEELGKSIILGMPSWLVLHRDFFFLNECECRPQYFQGDRIRKECEGMTLSSGR
jgi:hypothetical protein